MSELPETLRYLGYHLRVKADKASEQIDADRLSRAADEVERADLPPTLSAAMELPEIKMLVKRLDNPWEADDGIEKGAAPFWCGLYMQEAKHALTAALDEIERLRKVIEELADDAMELPELPTDAQLHYACLSYRHDYGLMDLASREKLQWECREWWRCISRAMICAPPEA